MNCVALVKMGFVEFISVSESSGVTTLMSLVIDTIIDRIGKNRGKEVDSKIWFIKIRRILFRIER